MKKKHCPVEALFKIIGQKWSAYILWVLCERGEMRFGALKKLTASISQKVLTEKLRQLEKMGIVQRELIPTVPPSVSYRLTEKGNSLRPLLMQVQEIAHDWRDKDFI